MSQCPDIAAVSVNGTSVTWFLFAWNAASYTSVDYKMRGGGRGDGSGGVGGWKTCVSISAIYVVFAPPWNESSELLGDWVVAAGRSGQGVSSERTEEQYGPGWKTEFACVRKRIIRFKEKNLWACNLIPSNPSPPTPFIPTGVRNSQHVPLLHDFTGTVANFGSLGPRIFSLDLSVLVTFFLEQSW